MVRLKLSVDNILKMSVLARDQASEFPRRRDLFYRLEKVFLRGRGRFVGIVGPRGVGKTVILKQILKDFGGIYISFDGYDIGSTDVFLDILLRIRKRFGVRLFLFDEVHYYPDFSSLVRMLYGFTDIRAIFTSSVAVVFSQLRQDLSRLVRLEYLYPFDFKEFLLFNYDIDVPYISFGELIEREKVDEIYWGVGRYFEEYLRGGVYPFSMEMGEITDVMRNVLERIVWEDVGRVISLELREIHEIEDMISFIGKSEVDGISYSSISRNVGLTKYKVRQYIKALEKAFVLNVVLPYGTNVKREPKILMAPSYRLLYRGYEEAKGGLREDFAVQMLKQKGFDFYYLKGTKGEKRPDFLVRYGNKKVVIEVGGRGKGYKQFKGLSDDYYKVVLKDGWDGMVGSLPLFIIGCVGEQ